MATSGLYGSSPTGAVVAAPGSETAGLYGSGTVFGGTYFEWFIFQESATAPATPTGGSWSFTTNTGTPPAGWSSAPPTSPTNTVWFSIALVNSRDSGSLTWTAPAPFSQEGPVGPPGTAATVTAGTTTTGAPGTSASVVNAGTTSAAVFNFTIPRGNTGDTGATGAAATITAGTTTTGAAGTSASVVNTGTSGAAIFDFTIPRGDTGATGPVGPTGATGAAATIAAGTTTTGSAGSSASVTNVGTSSAAVFNFTIPRGDTGATGPTGAAATIAVGTTTTGSPGTSATVTNVGTSGAAVFDFSIPRGAGVITGGNTGQFLAKASNADYDTTWLSITGGLSYQGLWNASTNTPTLTSGAGTAGTYYVVSVSGSTNLDGITDWIAGDWAIFNGTTWQKIDQTNLVTSVAGRTGAVTLTTADIGGLGTIATQNANTVAITGGSISGATLTTPTQVTYEDWTGITTPSYAEGRLWYDSTAHALTYFNDSSTDPVHIGQDLQIKVINNTGSTIANGSPVYITGTSSGQTYPNIALAKADVAATSAVIGLTNGAIANGSIGYVTSQGGIDNVNTGSYTVGQVLYLSPYSAGQLMNTIPPTGITVQVGLVSFVNSSTGKIYVRQTTPLNVPASIISGTLPIANGGTGQTTANTAFNALAPSQTSNSGKYLTTDGTNTSWATVSSGTSVTLSNDTSTAANLYPLFASTTSGTASTIYTGNAKLLYKPSTGELTSSTMISGNGISVNADSVTANYTIGSGNNGMSVGPLTVASGVTVTVSSGQRWIVL